MFHKYFNIYLNKQYSELLMSEFLYISLLNNTVSTYLSMFEKLNVLITLLIRLLFQQELCAH